MADKFVITKHASSSNLAYPTMWTTGQCDKCGREINFFAPPSSGYCPACLGEGRSSFVSSEGRVVSEPGAVVEVRQFALSSKYKAAMLKARKP